MAVDDVARTRASNASASAGASPSSRADDLTGRVLADRYRLRVVIGVGASGRVYEADDVQLERRVAVKVLHQGLGDDQGFLQRFRAEARVAASLQHQHIMTVHDWGEDDVPFMVMELLEGGSLRSLLDTGARLSPSQAARLGRDVAGALEYAHSRGIVHRDIKPANLLFDIHGHVRIADFGLARALAEASWTEPAGTVFGTARYASPEQASGVPLGARSDLYSLGLVLYESITGTIPFAADTVMGSLAMRTRQAVTAEPEWGPLRAVIERVGRVDPDERYPDAATMATALADACDALGLAAPIPLAEPSVPTIDPHPTMVVAAPRASDVAAAVSVAPAAPGTAPNLFDQDAFGEPAFGEPAFGEPAYGDDAGAARSGGGARSRTRPRRGNFVPLVVAVVVAAALVLGVVALGSMGAAAGTPVPGVIGRSASTARVLAERAGLALVVERRSSDDPAGIVIDQRPASGARTNGPIRVVVSTGPAPVTVPDLANLTRDEATLALDDAGLLVSFTEAYDETVPAGEVVSQVPAATTKADRDTQVAVVLSRGRAPREVPGLVGIDPDDAQTELEALGFIVSRREDFSEDVDAGLVVGTSPEAGESLPYGSAVELRVSKGPERIPVPNVFGLELDAACTELQDLGLKCDPDSSYRPGATVSGMDPQPGAKVARGTTVVLAF